MGAGIGLVRPAAVVVACNTASTIALGALRAAFDVPIVGCVPPVKPAAAASLTGHIGLLATPATIRRPYLQDLVERFAGGCEVHSVGTPVLAELAVRSTPAAKPSAARTIVGVCTPTPGWPGMSSSVSRLTFSTA